MTYYDLKALQKKIAAQKLRVAAARESAVSLSSAQDGQPHGTPGDRLSLRVERILAEEEKLNALQARMTASIRAIPDGYIQTLIHCKLVKGWSWTRIASEIGGGNTGDGIRKQCVRYRWKMLDGLEVKQ